jgi:hypothetical protein
VSDIRINGNFRNNRKRKRLEQLAGAKAVIALINLWIAAAESRPRGILHGWDAMDIAIEAQWEGAPDDFVTALKICGLLDVLDDGTYAIHDWRENQPFAFHRPERVMRSRAAVAARWEKRHPQQGNTDSNADSNATSNTDRIPPVCDPYTDRNTPIPIPIPIPTPNSITSAEPPSDSEPVAPAVYVIPLINRDGDFAITAEMLAAWAQTFPGVDVDLVVRQIVQWNRDNPQRRKTARGIRQHISGWLAKEQNRARPATPGKAAMAGGGQYDRLV